MLINAIAVCLEMHTIREFRSVAHRLQRSPGRRDLPHHVYWHCVKEFGSLNAAKLKAGLELKRRSPCKPLTDKQRLVDATLAKIVSYLTFDGHLHKSLRGFLLSSNSLADLKTFEALVVKKFGIRPKKLERNAYCYGDKNYRIWFFNTEVSKFLHSVGTPKGNKTVTSFRVPGWIKNDKEFSREYLRVAYLCEGSNKENRTTPRIQFTQNKARTLLANGLELMNDIKEMLAVFGISIGKISVGLGNVREDGVVTLSLKFRVSARDNKKFYQEIGWLK